MSEPRALNLTNAQFEHTLGILGELDLSPLLGVFKGGSMVDVLALLPMLGQAREKKLFRRLESVWGATPEELEKAEADPAQVDLLLRKAAQVPIKDTLEGLTAFFGSLGLSLSDTPGFLKSQTTKNLPTEEAPGEGAAASPSVG